METWTYLLKVNAAIAVFYMVYRWCYRNDTFFTLRRYLLQGILFLSVVYPFTDFSKWFVHSHTLTEAAFTYTQYMPELTVTPSVEAPATYSLGDYALWLYLAVTGFLLLRLMGRLTQLVWLRWRSPQVEIEGARVSRLQRPATPFSFFNWIFIHPEMHRKEELKEILAHEQIHVRQHHSFDILLAELSCAVCWFNPMAWMLKKEIHSNLEFLVDHRVVKDGADARSYQYHLLRMAHQPVQTALANQFNTSPLKKRIRMLNAKQSPKVKLVAYTLMLPLALLLLVANNAGAMTEQMSGLLDASLPMLQGHTGNLSDTKKGDSLVVSGTVVDGQGALQGVSIIIRGTYSGTISDENGRFQIRMQAGDTLYFSYIGMAPVHLVPKASGDVGKIEMKRKKENLDEIVVVGYTSSEKGTRNDRKPSTGSEGEPAFTVVEEMPLFPGGQAALMQYIARNIKYPVIAQENGIQGRVVCQFIIDERGNTADVQVIQGVDPLLDKEAVRLIEEMPRWNTGRQSGKPVSVEYTVPQNFRLTKGAVCSIQKDTTRQTQSRQAPIRYYLNGKEIFSERMKSIPPAEIENIHVLNTENRQMEHKDKTASKIIIITTLDATADERARNEEIKKKFN